MATLALSSGAADVAVVQRLLGHASLATTGIYLDEIREELAQAVLRNPVTGSK
jgi:site-specific recombinase XerD